MYYKNKIFLVYGLEKSGLASIKLLVKKGSKVYAFDDNKSLTIKTEVEKVGGIIVDNAWIDAHLHEVYVIVISPGVQINNKLCVKAKKLGIRIIGELELGIYNTNMPIVAVTGTNGKTTTVNMLSEIFSAEKIANVKCGNIGFPLCECCFENDKVALLEVSSFQMETCLNICPHVSVILNITPNHLDRHYNMDFYTLLKKRLILNGRESEYAVLNADDKIVSNFASDCKSKIKWFSIKNQVDGAYIKDEIIYYCGQQIVSVKDLSLTQEHNLYNTLASIVVAKLFDIDNKSIVKALSAFKPPKHRIELVRKIGDTCYYDDSKSTNVASTISAIKSISKECVLILGGRSKGDKFDKLFKYIKTSCVIHIVLYGETRFEMLNTATTLGYNNITVCSDFKSAVKVACMVVKNGQDVLLSPACSSKDEFVSYVERGNIFASIVTEIDEKGKNKEKRA